MSKEFSPDRAALAIILIAPPSEKRRISIKLLESNATDARENIIVVGLAALYRYESVEVGTRLINHARPTQAELDALAPVVRRELLEIIGFSWLTPQGRAVLDAQNLVLTEGDTFLHP